MRPCARLMISRARASFPEYLLHRFPLRKLVDQLIEVANFLHPWILNIFHADAADHPCNQIPQRIQSRGLTKELLEAGFRLQFGVEFLLGVARQPADDLIDLGSGASFPLRLGDIVRIDAGKACGIDSMLRYDVPLPVAPIARTRLCFQCAGLSNWRRTDSNLPAALHPFLFSTSALRNKNRWILPLGVFGNSPTKSISRG